MLSGIPKGPPDLLDSSSLRKRDKSNTLLIKSYRLDLPHQDSYGKYCEFRIASIGLKSGHHLVVLDAFSSYYVILSKSSTLSVSQFLHV